MNIDSPLSWLSLWSGFDRQKGWMSKSCHFISFESALSFWLQPENQLWVQIEKQYHYYKIVYNVEWLLHILKSDKFTEEVQNLCFGQIISKQYWRHKVSMNSKYAQAAKKDPFWPFFLQGMMAGQPPPTRFGA